MQMSVIIPFPAPEQEHDDSAILTAVMESCTESLAILEGGKVFRANRAFAQTLGYHDSADVQDLVLADLAPECNSTFPPHQQNTAIRNISSENPSVRECTIFHKDGRQLSFRVASAPFHVRQRELMVVNLQPASEREPEPPLFEPQKLEAMGRLVSGVAHDFNNLLTGILLYCDLLIAGLQTDSPLRTYVEEIRAAGEHSSGLIRQLLAVARPQPAASPATSWNEVVLGMRNLLQRLLGENIELITDLAADTAVVKIEPGPLRQILLNLLLNARDAMPQGGRITLSTRRCLLHSAEALLAGAELTVADTGCGMDAVTRARLFEMFFTTKQRGNGLGLATVYRIVKEENGTIEVESEPGKGARVTVRLPLLNPEMARFDPGI